MINMKQLRCIKLLVVGFWPCLSATAQSRADLRGPATISRGDSAKYEVMLVVPGFSVRRVAHPVRLTATCGSFDANGEYHAPSSAGRCTLTAVVQDGSGRRVTGSKVIDVFEPAMDSGQATPRRGARTPKPAARAAPPIARAAPPIVLTAPPPTTTARMARRDDALPQFPWPPPAPTTRMVIPRRLLTAPILPSDSNAIAGDRLGDVADSIEHALNRAGLDFAAYAIGDSGFAYVSQVEMIHVDGTYFPPPKRFPDDVHTASSRGGFLSFITSRFFASPGYFRVIAIVVTSRDLRSAPTTLSVDSATSLAHGGMATLPVALRSLVVPNLQFEALVYEFEKHNAADSVALRAAAPPQAREHLSRAGLWSLDDLQPRP